MTNELEKQLDKKKQIIIELQETISKQVEEIKNLNYTLYEERNLTTDLAKANLRISTLERDLSSTRNRFKHEHQQNKEIIKAKEQECEELKKELQAQRDFTAHEQKLIYCVAYDETCKTGNDCKQEKCIFKDNIKLKQTLAEIKEIAEGMHDLWINKTQYTDMNNLVEHLLECELNRIRYKLDEIRKCDDENERILSGE